MIPSTSPNSLNSWLRQATPQQQQAALNYLALRSPAGFATVASRGKWILAPHLDLINRKLVGVAEGRIKRLLISMPPRHGKSQLVSTYTPPWYLSKYPDRRVILAAYEHDFAASWGRKSRDLTTEHSRLLGLEVNPTLSRAHNWQVKGYDGGMLTAGVGGPLTGYGADLLIFDDPIKNSDQANSPTFREKTWEWWQSTAYTRLMPQAAVVGIMCMVGDTPVLMGDGAEKPLRDVRPGDKVATYDKGVITTSRVLNWKNQGLDQIYAITMASGRIVRANERHPFLVTRSGMERWTRLRDLKVGDGIVAVTSSGGRGVGSSAPRRGATSPPDARGSATTIIGSPERSASAPPCPHTTQTNDERLASSIGTGSPRENTTHFSPPRAGSVPSADCRPRPTSAPTGAANSASTTITTAERCERSSATTATSWSDTGNQKKPCSGVLNTFEIIPDRIVSIVPAGREDVFDIEVEGTENFIANTLVSHNTRWNEDDLIGRILKTDEHWEVINLPAIAEEGDLLGRKPGEALWPDRFPLPDLERIRSVQGSYYWSALYQGHPTPRDGGFFKDAWFRYVEKLPEIQPPQPQQVQPHGLYLDRPPTQAAAEKYTKVRGWDLAATEDGDWTVGVLIARHRDAYYVEDVVRERLTPNNRDNLIRKTAERDGIEVRQWFEQEPGSAGVTVAAHIKKLLAGFAVQSERSTGNKQVRAEALASALEGGNVTLVRGDWNARFREELLQFPNGKHDDQVDATSLAFNKLAAKLTVTIR